MFDTHIPRRAFLGTAGLAAAAGAIGTLGGCSSALTGGAKLRKTYDVDLAESRVSLVTGGTNRREMVYEAMRPFKDQIEAGLRNRNAFIKINCVMHDLPLIATHPDAVRGILDFIKPFHKGKVLIGESTASERGALALIEQYGFLPLANEYDNVEFLELNDQPTTYQYILDPDLRPTKIRIINTFLDPDNYTFSVTRLKTHNVVIITLSLKNVVMGSPLKIPKLQVNEKSKMHGNSKGNQSPKMLHYNLFRIAHYVRPDFAVLDGVEGVEGDGPTMGEPVDHQVVLAGTDFLSVDRIGTELMGVPWEDMGYLNFCQTDGLGQGDRDKIRILGPDPRGYVRKYKLHSNIAWQYTWKDDLVIPRGVE